MGGGGIGVSGVVGGGVGCYNFPKSTNKIKSFDEVLTSEKKKIFAFFCCGGGSNLILGQVWKTKYLFEELQLLSSFFIKFSKIVTLV